MIKGLLAWIMACQPTLRVVKSSYVKPLGSLPVRFGINLRGDLAKLGDAEIATKFEALIADRETMYRAVPWTAGNKWLYQRGWGQPLGRGPLHARIFYKYLGLSYYSFRNPSLYDLYLLDCELKDTRDEIERRVKRQKTALATQ